MSFYCHATKDMVSGESRVLVPVAVRKVKYVGTMTRKNRNSDKPIVIYTGDSEGWEVSKEVPVCASKAEKFAEENPPVQDGAKEVTFYKKKKRQDFTPDDQRSGIDFRSERVESLEKIEIGRSF